MSFHVTPHCKKSHGFSLMWSFRGLLFETERQWLSMALHLSNLQLSMLSHVSWINLEKSGQDIGHSGWRYFQEEIRIWDPITAGYHSTELYYYLVNYLVQWGPRLLYAFCTRGRVDHEAGSVSLCLSLLLPGCRVNRAPTTSFMPRDPTKPLWWQPSPPCWIPTISCSYILVGF